MVKFYVVGVYGADNFSLLNPEGDTLQRCESAIRWQNSPRECNTVFHICKPTQEREVFARVDTGERLRVNRGPFTEDAHAEFMAAIWPAGA